MKKLWKWIVKNKDIVGLVMHTAWLGLSFGILDMNQLQQAAGHGVIFQATGVGVIQRYNRNKEKVNATIKKATKIFNAKDKK